MAQLKDTVVSGNLRVTDTTLTDELQVDTIKTHSSSGANTLTAGTDGQILKTDGTSSYWGSITLDNVTDGATRKLSDYAPKASPALTGTPTAPTATAGTNTTQIATTAFVTNAVTTATVWEAGTGENSVVVKGCEGVANGIYSTVEGYQSETGGTYTENTKEATEDSSAGSYAHAEGVCTIASGARGSHAEGRFTLASGGGAHAEGSRTVASGMIAHAEGNTTLASGDASHAEGYDTKSSNVTSHAEGLTTVSSGYASHAEGCCSKAIGSRSHAEGTMTKAYGSGSHAENGNWWIDITSITGSANTTSYVCTFSEVNKVNEIVELYETLGSTKFINLMKTASLCKSGYGQDTFMIAVTNVSNISLSNNILTCTFTLEKTLSETALSNASNYRISTNGSFGNFSHAENGGSAIGYDSHAEGSSSYSIGDESHAEGYVTLALNDYEHAQGTYNKSTKTSSTFGNAGNTIHSVGIGTSSARKNAEEIMQNGDMYLIGVGNYNGTNFSEAQTVQQVINGFNDIEEVTSAALNDLNDRVSDLELQEIHTKLETSQPSGGFKPNTFYNLGTISGSVTFSLAAATDNTIVNHYYWTFETGSTAPTITWPSNITWVDNSNPNINSNKHYEVSILNGIGVYMEI